MGYVCIRMGMDIGMDVQRGGGGELDGWALGCWCLLEVTDSRMVMSDT